MVSEWASWRWSKALTKWSCCTTAPTVAMSSSSSRVKLARSPILQHQWTSTVLYHNLWVIGQCFFSVGLTMFYNLHVYYYLVRYQVIQYRPCQDYIERIHNIAVRCLILAGIGRLWRTFNFLLFSMNLIWWLIEIHYLVLINAHLVIYGICTVLDWSVLSRS